MILRTQIRNIYDKHLDLKGEPGAIVYGLAMAVFITDHILTGIAALGWKVLLPLLIGGVIMAPLSPCRPIIFRTD